MSCENCGHPAEHNGNEWVQGHWPGCPDSAAMQQQPRPLVILDDDDEGEPAEGGETVGQCEVAGCENPKYSTDPRTKYCADHKDPKNRKE